MDSVSVLPTFLGNGSAQAKREFVFIQGDDKDTSVAVRSGRWKLIVRYDAARKESYERYNLTDDPGESSDVSNDHSAVVAQLANALAKAEIAGRTRP